MFRDNSGPLYQVESKETIMKGRITITLLKSAELGCGNEFTNQKHEITSSSSISKY